MDESTELEEVAELEELEKHLETSVTGAGSRNPDRFRRVPNKYKPHYAIQAMELARNGALDKDLEKFFQVGRKTLHNWRTKFPEFANALQIGRDQADGNVEASLYQRAMGYEHESTKVFKGKDDKPVVVKYRVHEPADTIACIFWLKNRKREEWNDRAVLAGDKDAPIKLQVTYVGAAPAASVEVPDEKLLSAPQTSEEKDDDDESDG